MHVILSKMIQGLLPTSSSSSSPSSSSPGSSGESRSYCDSATRDVLVSTIQTILNRGCIVADEVHKMDNLLNVGGAVWYAEHLVRVSIFIQF